MGISGNVKSALESLCENKLSRRGKRGRPKGAGRDHPKNSCPKTFRNFSPLSHQLLFHLRAADPELKRLTESELVEEALARLAVALSNSEPRLREILKGHGR
jgi:hypothetical protein